MNKLCRLFLCLLALPALLLSGCAGGGADGDAAGGGASAAPSAAGIVFEGTDLEGNAVSSDVFSRSRLTMVNVWATYCGPCLGEMPGLGELAAEYDPEEFQIIGIVSDALEGEDQTLAESLVRQTGADYPHLLLNESIYYALLTEVDAVPTTFFVDGHGAVLDTVVGAMEKEEWEARIDGLLEKR